MARNRKRAKDRRARRPTTAPVTGRGLATARPDRDATPDPIEHAAPDVELAEAQLALGRPELAPEDPVSDGGSDGLVDESFVGHGARVGEDFISEDEALSGEDEALSDDELAVNGEAPPGGAGPPSSGGGLARSPGAMPAPRRHAGGKLINFLQGSWRELQRVQWPDRRQVMQATGVVIGFVIVAGVFLGLSDTLATKVVTLILK